MKKLKLGCKIVSILIALALIMHWQTVYLAYQSGYQSDGAHGWSLFMITLASVFVILNAVAAVGMFLTKRWGFIVTYLAIIFSTAFFSISYVPFINRFFPEAAMSTLIINALLILYVAYLDVYSRKRIKAIK